MYTFQAGDPVRVQYQWGKYLTGRVLWTENYGGLTWVTVRPDNPAMIHTFGSARDMGNGYKSYIANDPVLGRVEPITMESN